MESELEGEAAFHRIFTRQGSADPTPPTYAKQGDCESVGPTPLEEGRDDRFPYRDIAFAIDDIGGCAMLEIRSVVRAETSGGT